MTGIKQPAYLYSLWNDKFTVSEGYVYIITIKTRAHAQFDCPNRPDYVVVDPAPGVIRQAKLWLLERDDELAKRLLVEYHEGCIEDLKKKLRGHEQKLDILKQTELA